MSLLKLKGITIKFGGLTAASNVSIDVSEKVIAAIIGPNGAGKTTIFNAITGIYPPHSGEIFFKDRSIEEPFTVKILIRAVIAAIATAISLVLAVNAQSLWQASIIDLFVYGQPFSWRAATESFFSFLISLPFSDTVLPALIGGTIALTAVFVWWNRSRHAPQSVAEQGIARTFQNIRLFPKLTAIENVLVGMHQHSHTSWLGVIFGGRSARIEHSTQRTEARKLLDFVGIATLENAQANSLCYGDQRRLEIARALAIKPELVLLDEPAAGMNHTETDKLMHLIEKIREEGITVLLIEHHMKLVMGVSDRITVLEYGHKIAEGTPQEVRANPRVIKAYLGSEASDG